MSNICEHDELSILKDKWVLIMFFFFNYVCENNGQDMVLVLNETYFDLFGVIIRSMQVDILIK